MKRSNTKVLIVDDEPQVGQLLYRYLSSDGYDCSTALSGEEALKLLEAEEFHLLVTDIVMAGMSGVDLLNIVRPLYPQLAVLIVTSVDDRDTGVLALELGAYGYIIKPFERNEILINVANALERRRLAIVQREKTPSYVPVPNVNRKRPEPVRISAKQVLDCLRSSMDHAALMKRFNLSAKALYSLLDQLVAAGYLRQSEMTQLEFADPGTVVVDLSDTFRPAKDLQKPRISASDAVKCIKSGMHDSDLMERFNISAKGLRSLFRKMVAAGIIDQSALDKRMSQTHSWAVLEEDDLDDFSGDGDKELEVTRTANVA
jgi:DNA-binding response OmpR family regulator